jgi:hypothetical protein
MPDPMICSSAAKIDARYSCSLRVPVGVLLGFSARPATGATNRHKLLGLNGIQAGLRLPRTA